MERGGEPPPPRRIGRLVGLATELGVTMGLTAASLVVLGLLAGRWLDARLGTGGLATMALVVAGAVAGQISIYRLAMRSVGGLAAGQERVPLAREAVSAVGLAFKALALLILPGLVGLGLGLALDAMLGIGALAPVGLAGLGLLLGLLGAVHVALRAGRPLSPEGPARTEPSPGDGDREACP